MFDNFSLSLSLKWTRTVLQKKKMNGIGIHSNEGNAVLKFERKKKEKRERNERNHNDIPYCDFITAELILFGSESLRIAFRFRGVKNTSCKYPQYPRPVPVLLRCRLRSLVSLFSRVNTFPAPIIPLPLEEKPEKLEGTIESCPRLPRIFQRLFLLLSFLLSLLPPLSLRLIVRHACTCVPFYRARLKGCHPSFFPIFFLSRSFPSSSLLSRHSVSGQPSKPVISKRTKKKKKKVFSVTPFPLPLLSSLHSFGHVKGKR